MSQATRRCDEIIRLIDRCLAACEVPRPVERRATPVAPSALRAVRSA
jgi:hypothetical protein